MALLELVHPEPDWEDALEAALTPPPGVPERRDRQRAVDGDPPDGVGHRRVADDLIWLRHAVDEPDHHGLEEVRGTAAVAVWKAEDDAPTDRLCHLRDRGVLEAAGFLLHESSVPS